MCELQPQILYNMCVLPEHMKVIVYSVVCVCAFVLYLLVGLHFAAHHSEGVGHRVVIDLDTTEGKNIRSRWHPALPGIIVQHDFCPHLADTGLTVERRHDE